LFSPEVFDCEAITWEVVMRALIIVDMLNDFVDGKLANPKAQAIIGPLQRLLEHARDDGWVVVFSNDAHQPDDPELRVWGEHAMAGTREAEVIPQLAPLESEIVSPKRVYGAFDFTGLDEQLKQLGVDEVVITGQHTHICVRHSSYGALIRGYTISIPRDGVCGFEGVDEDEALAYLQMAYGAAITTVDELVEASTAVHV
jgi:nicotinamidase-related amidase